MDDKDRIFARFKNDKPETSVRREVLTSPRRAGATGSRVVEVVHVQSGGAIKDGPSLVIDHAPGPHPGIQMLPARAPSSEPQRGNALLCA